MVKLLAMANDEGAAGRIARPERAYEARAKLAGRTARVARRKRVVEAIEAERNQSSWTQRVSCACALPQWEKTGRCREERLEVPCRGCVAGLPTEFCGWCDVVA